MPRCCVFIAVITAVVIGTLTANVDAKEALEGKKRWTRGGKLLAKAGARKNPSGKKGGTQGGTSPVKVDAKKDTEGGKKGGTKGGTVGDKCAKSIIYGKDICSDMDLYKCNFKRLLEECPTIPSLNLQGKSLTGTLPGALQSFPNLTALYVETCIHFIS